MDEKTGTRMNAPATQEQETIRNKDFKPVTADKSGRLDFANASKGRPLKEGLEKIGSMLETGLMKGCSQEELVESLAKFRRKAQKLRETLAAK